MAEGSALAVAVGSNPQKFSPNSEMTDPPELGELAQFRFETIGASKLTYTAEPVPTAAATMTAFEAVLSIGCFAKH